MMNPASLPNENLEREDFEFFRDRITRLAGIHLSDSKFLLLQSRLRERLQDLRIPDFSSYREYLSTQDPRSPEWQAFINVLTTNKTDWFREPAHFDFLVQKILPARLAYGAGGLSVWSAACSTGQEAYTLAMVLAKELSADRDFRILASDLDTSVLRKAQRGIYPTQGLQDVPEAYHALAFARGTGAISEWMKVRKELKQRVSFERHNLLERRSPSDPKHDVIFCRNVLIYFSKPTIQRVVENLFESAKPGAFLVIGHTESLQGITTRWRLVRPSIFQAA